MLTARQMREIGADILKAIEPVGKQHGVAISLGTTTYGGLACSIKLEVSLPDTSGNPMTKHASDFQMLAQAYGFSPDDLWREFTLSGTRYKLIGMLPRSRNSIVGERLDSGAKYKLSPEAVKAALAKEKAPAVEGKPSKPAAKGGTTGDDELDRAYD